MNNNINNDIDDNDIVKYNNVIIIVLIRITIIMLMKICSPSQNVATVSLLYNY